MSSVCVKRIAQPRRGVHHPRRSARLAEATALARERDHGGATAVIAVHAREAVRQHATSQERLDLPQAELRHRPFPGFDPAQERPPAGLHGALQHRPLGLTPRSFAIATAH
jgi:hypothetical protein